MAAKEKKGLGTGLAALFGDDDFEESSSELLTLPISKVEPRKDYIFAYADFNKKDDFVPVGEEGGRA